MTSRGGESGVGRAAVGVAGDRGAVPGARVLQPASTTAAMQHVQASGRVVRRFMAASIGRPAPHAGCGPWDHSVRSAGLNATSAPGSNLFGIGNAGRAKAISPKIFNYPHA